MRHIAYASVACSEVSRTHFTYTDVDFSHYEKLYLQHGRK